MAHDARLRSDAVGAVVRDVRGALVLGQQQLQRLARQLARRVAEHRLERPVRQRDPAGPVERDDAERRAFEQRAERFKQIADHRFLV